MLLLGLGNPGAEYLATRHNIGFLFVDFVSEKGTLRQEEETPHWWKAELRLGRRRLHLAKPLTFMNRSGPPALGLLRRLRIPLEDLIVAHDDKDLAFGRIQVRRGGGDAGHKGVQSLVSALGTEDFIRFRLGIGAEDMENAADYVLSDFTQKEQDKLDGLLERAYEALRLSLSRGYVAAMNRINGLPAL